MNNNNLHSHIIISIIFFIQFNYLIMIIISLTNYSQSQWVNVHPLSAASPLVINPKKLLSHPCFWLCHNLPIRPELSPHLMITTVSLLPSVLMKDKKKTNSVRLRMRFDWTGRSK